MEKLNQYHRQAIAKKMKSMLIGGSIQCRARSA